jgi:hypothetical protein
LEILEKAEDGEQTETPSGMTLEAKERALKIIILVTKLSLAGASTESEKELQTALVVPDLNPVLQQSDSQFYFILFVAVILFAGFLIGACVMGIFMWHRVGKLTVVSYKGFIAVPKWSICQADLVVSDGCWKRCWRCLQGCWKSCWRCRQLRCGR